MTFDEVINQLAAWGSEGFRAIYTRQGAGPNQFGVKMGDLRGLAKKLKTDHALALQLWASGNLDAMILATMLLDPRQLSESDVETMLAPLSYYRLVDELTFNAVARTAFARPLAQRWCAASDEWAGRAGWNVWIAQIIGGAQNLDCEALLSAISVGMKTAPVRKQEAMNRCLVEIAVHFPGLTQRCIEIGERLGRLDDKPVPKGCTSSYAPEWIAAVLCRNAGRSKRTT